MTAGTAAEFKALAAERAAGMVADGMLVGLGTGSTAALFVEALGRRVRAGGLRVQAVATSEASAAQAAEFGIPLVDRLAGPVDLAVDGADEVDPDLNLVKGRGGALVREKLVAQAAERFVVIVDESKLVDRLGRGPLPVEVLPFLWERTALRLEELGLPSTLRRTPAGDPFVSDNGNLVLDAEVAAGIPAPAAMGARIKALTGVVDHGIFAGLTSAAVVAGPGGIRVMGSID